MKSLFFLLIIFASLAPIAFAASDCAHTCCRTYNGSWDDDFDDCRHPAAGFDGCVSECEAKVWASRPQGPGPASPENTYSCKVGAILLGVLGGTILLRKS